MTALSSLHRYIGALGVHLLLSICLPSWCAVLVTCNLLAVCITAAVAGVVAVPTGSV